MTLVVRIVGLILVVIGFVTLYFAAKHGRPERWTIVAALCYLVAGITGGLFISWWPILAGAILGTGISRYGGVARDRR
jgi:cytochrome bd-type quinol oxidase subunit 2